MDNAHSRPNVTMSSHRDTDVIIVTVVEALAEADRLDLDEVEYTLYEYINPEILTELADQQNGSWEFTFEVADHEVTLASDGRLFVDGVLCRTDLTLRESSSTCPYR
ncbi:hypothetical protein GS429_09775 [Natronorubrum sp. JWXQ-INN-674]|uniref:Halobacterial output domain-containing protein n=2 Tax=Natronorubrum halalkaliphilum TaxID=2691917 RepID=A0A6B0VLA0_9EURY|nr:hypothetical protein [Natronorubrum halalkaliphilum]